MTQSAGPIAWDFIFTIAGATTALVAAALSGITLYLTGRRETRQWLRDSVLDALTQFLDASFARPSRSAYEARQASGFEGDLDRFRARSTAAHREQNDALTKLRLLANDPVVRAAETLHLADDAIADAVLGSGPAPDPSDWATLRLRQKHAREALIVQARRLLGLPGGVPVGSLDATDDSRTPGAAVTTSSRRHPHRILFSLMFWK
ncbi:hypothetical protein [Myceligenerans salitolerans]|uniref:Uncharacterized protein n=1 Tax=Myceligenerans salitolerans TaxID=1230528 RepID=A0ABS3IA12_9MICO|nr:hypothetical protein [Myceligenerans salitolerans]MBO0609861.1 hypothetical protein [Myceligenerans salitolerans]